MSLWNPLAKALPLLRKGDAAIERYREDTMMRGSPEGVLRARDLKDVEEALRFCRRSKIPVTFCGSQTSMTGASVATEGLLVSTEKMERLLEIGTFEGKPCAKAEPGIILSDLKRKAAEAGFFYPPGPTSQDEARLGGTVATNAAGEDSLQYGTTRPYIREIKVLLANGEKKVFQRKAGEAVHDELGRGGYRLDARNPMELFIGSEGTLGFIYEITVDLVRTPADYFSALAPFPDTGSALRFTQMALREKGLRPRALEFVDTLALAYMRRHPGFPEGLENAQALIYFKQEYEETAGPDTLLNRWMGLIVKHSTKELAEKTVVAFDEKRKNKMRHWRHHIPLAVNEEYRAYWAAGGGKVGSDWWVPLEKMETMTDHVYRTAAEARLPVMAYAHVGMGHPHVNTLCKTAEEKERGLKHLKLCCQKAVALGGGVAGEHGIGKLHRNLLPVQWSAAAIARMRRIKKEWDPEGILGRGNIL